MRLMNSPHITSLTPLLLMVTKSDLVNYEVRLQEAIKAHSFFSSQTQFCMFSSNETIQLANMSDSHIVVKESISIKQEHICSGLSDNGNL